MTSPEPLDERLAGLMIRDRHRLARRLARVARATGPGAERERAGLERAIAAARERRAARAAGAPALAYPAELPVTERRAEIVAAIAAHPVLVVAGETGSGKTTQLPKMCLEAGRGIDGMVGHTQPRRIAARTVAERLAEELAVPLGGAVGYAVRFTDTVGPETLVKVMTDGILLAEIRRDPMLSAYDTLIVDEAHERSLNIDFLLGYLAQLLARRSDLRVVITSATIDTARFAEHFSAPVIEVSGRTYPVEVRYRPVGGEDGDEDADPNQAIVDAVHEAVASGPGDALVFLPGERDIRDAAEALRASGPEGLEILPLYARLSAAEQHRVFRPGPQRRVVLATNVAETSLTVPRIRFVIDTGLARVSRYSHRTKVQRLPIEPVSRASADQRAGRCGRVAPGVCIRLYAEEDYAQRPEFTDPEILRTNLASVILQMAAIGLGEIESFPFLEPPDRRAVADGRALLEELGAFSRTNGRLQLSAVGRSLAELPLDPRLGRMVLAAVELGCLREVTVVAAALSIQDPRERPLAEAAAADALHARFVVDGSDFLSFVALWDYLAGIQSELSGNQFRRRLKAEHLNVLRVREWQDVASQIRQVLRGAGIHANTEPARPEQVHQALLAGLLSQIGMRDKVRGDYLGARNTRWQIGRASALAKRQPAWVMAAALVETERTFARTVARIEPAWAERIGAHLVKRRYSEPWWDPARGEAMADERVTLYGLPVVSSRRVSYGRVDPAAARDLFIQRALVERDWPVALAPLETLDARRAEVRALEERVRRHGLLAPDEVLFAYFDRVLPAEVTNGQRLVRWWRRASPDEAAALEVPLAVLVDASAGPVGPGAFPDVLAAGDVALALRYRWRPGAPDDGVTAEVPLAALHRVDPAALAWHVPGHRLELVAALIRSLPRALRRAFAPVADVAAAVLGEVGPDDGPPAEVLARQLARRSGEAVTPALFAPESLPAHLRIHLEVVDADHVVRGRGDDLAALQRALAPEVRAAIARALPGYERHGARQWDFGDLPPIVESGAVRAYPALSDEHDAVGVVLCETPAAQRAEMWLGTRRLLLLATPLSNAHLERRLTKAARLAVVRAALPLDELFGECAVAVADEMVHEHGGPSFSEAGFAALAAAARAGLAERVARLANAAGDVLAAAERVDAAADALEQGERAAAVAPALADVRRQVDDLVHPGFITALGEAHLADVVRYLDAARLRLERLPTDARRDAERQATVGRALAGYDRAAAAVEAAGRPGDALARLDAARLLIEELRVSLWAQALGTPTPVSEERVRRALEQVVPGAAGGRSGTRPNRPPS